MRITLDTNQLVRALMRPPELATFIMAWQERRFTVVCSTPLLDEYQRVLDYPDVTEMIYSELRRTFFTQLIIKHFIRIERNLNLFSSSILLSPR